MGRTTGSRPHTGEKTDVEKILSAWDRLRKQYKLGARGVRLELITKDLDGALGNYQAAYVDNEGKQISPTIRVSLPALRKSIESSKEYPMTKGGYYRGRGNIVNLANAVVRHELGHRREEEAERKTGEPDISLPLMKPGDDVESGRYGGEPPHGKRWNRINNYLQGIGSGPVFSNIGYPYETTLPSLRSAWREG